MSDVAIVQECILFKNACEYTPYRYGPKCKKIIKRIPDRGFKSNDQNALDNFPDFKRCYSFHDKTTRIRGLESAICIAVLLRHSARQIQLLDLFNKLDVFNNNGKLPLS